MISILGLNDGAVVKPRISGFTLIELIAAVGIFATVSATLLDVFAHVVILSRENTDRYTAFQSAQRVAEKVKQFTSGNEALFNTFDTGSPDPEGNEVSVTDSDGDRVFNTKLAKVLIVHKYASLTGGAMQSSQIVLWKGEL